MISKFPSGTNIANSRRKMLCEREYSNTGVVCHWSGKIACLRDVESHCCLGVELEQICLEAGGWTGWPLECLSKVSQQWVFSWLIHLISEVCRTCLGHLCSLGSALPPLRVGAGGTRVSSGHADLAPPPPPLAAAVPGPSTESFLGNVLGSTALCS